MVRGLVVVIAFVLGAVVARADDEVEQRIRADVAAAGTEVATQFEQGNAARAAGRLEEAAAAYRKASELAPTLDHPQRRLCGVLHQMGQLGDAFSACERALALRVSSFNRTSLAAVLLSRGGPADLDRALRLAADAVAQAPEDASALATWCQALILNNRERQLVHECIDRWRAIAPDDLGANYVSALVAADDGDYDLARWRLKKAKAAGLEQAAYDKVSQRFDEAEEQNATFPKWVHTSGWIAAWIVVGWIGVMIVILVIGVVLSRKTLGTVNATIAKGTGDGEGSAQEQRLRRIYKLVLLVSGVYFYLSIPILLGATVAAGIGALLVFWAMGFIPIKLAAIIGLVVIATVGAIVRSLVVRGDSKPPGERIDLAAHPKLRAILDDVATAVGTRAVDAAYLTPGTELAVTEAGGLWTSVRGRHTERSLIIGVGLFERMSQLQFRSVLAHEYGHFRNRDTAGGGLALAVRRSLMTLIIRLAGSGVAGSFNPVWWFLRGFHRMYFQISQGASRLQEVLADRWAIQAYGSAGFIAGYRFVVERSVEFDHAVEDTLKEVMEECRPLPNLYTYEASTRTTKTDLATAIEAAMTREPEIFDSHPSPRQRIAWAEQLAVTREPHADDDADVWALFSERESLEHAMTKVVRDQIFNHRGIEIPAVAKPAEGGAVPDEPANDDGGWKGYSRE